MKKNMKAISYAIDVLQIIFVLSMIVFESLELSSTPVRSTFLILVYGYYIYNVYSLIKPRKITDIKLFKLPIVNYKKLWSYTYELIVWMGISVYLGYFLYNVIAISVAYIVSIIFCITAMRFIIRDWKWKSQYVISG